MDEDQILNRYLKEIRSIGRISNSDTCMAIDLIRNSKNRKEVAEAKERIVKGHLRLVLKYAIQMHRKFKPIYRGCSILDFIAEGNIALMKSVASFDTSRSVNFCTYASVAIKHSIERFLKKIRFVHIPEDHFRHRSTLNRIEKDYGNKLTVKEKAKMIGVSEKLYKMMLDGIKIEMVSLDNQDVFREEIIDQSTETSWQEYEIREYFLKILEILKPRDAEIVKMKFLDETERTYGEISEVYGISRQRVDQIVARSLKMLKRKILADKTLDITENKDNKNDNTDTNKDEKANDQKCYQVGNCSSVKLYCFLPETQAKAV
jgi:RNA polymerase primary sigma factor